MACWSGDLARLLLIKRAERSWKTVLSKEANCINSGDPTSSQLQLPDGGGSPLLTASCSLYTPNSVCVQEKCLVDPDPKRPLHSSSPLIQVCKCRWKCVSLMMCRHRQAPPLPAVKGTPARTLPARSLSHLRRLRAMLQQVQVPQTWAPSGVCRDPDLAIFGMANTHASPHGVGAGTKAVIVLSKCPATPWLAFS